MSVTSQNKPSKNCRFVTRDRIVHKETQVACVFANVTGTNDYHIGFVPLDLERDDLHLQLKLCFCCRMTV